MKLLLDTHIWIWALNNPKKLNRKVRLALGSPKNELWLSPISVWEFLLLCERKRIKLHANTKPQQWLESAFLKTPIIEAPLTREVALHSRILPFIHDDPADRFIAATAAIYDLSLVTSDERLLNTTGFKKLSNI